MNSTIPITGKIFSSHFVVFDEIKSSELAYTSLPYSEALTEESVVSYIPCAASSHEQTGYIITFAQLEEGILV